MKIYAHFCRRYWLSAVLGVFLSLHAPTSLKSQEADRQVLVQNERDDKHVELVRALDAKSEGEQAKAIDGLDRLGKDVTVVLPELIKAFERQDNPVLKRRLARLFGNLGPSAESAVLSLLQTYESSTDEKLKAVIASAFSKIGPLASDAIPNLLVDLENSANSALRSNAANALGKVGQSNPALIDSLRKVLRVDQETQVKAACAIAISQFGYKAAVAVPELREQLRQSRDENVSLAIVVSLGSIGPMAKSAVPELIDQLAATKWVAVRREAATTLGVIGHDAVHAADALGNAVRNDVDSVVRVRAVIALAAVAENDPKQLRLVVIAMRDPDPWVRQAAASIAPMNGEIRHESIRMLTTLLEDPVSTVRLAAISSLGYGGTDSKQALLQLIDALADERNRNIRDNIVLAISRIVSSLHESDDFPLVIAAMRRLNQKRIDDPVFQTARSVLENARDRLSARAREQVFGSWVLISIVLISIASGGIIGLLRGWLSGTNIRVEGSSHTYINNGSSNEQIISLTPNQTIVEKRTRQKPVEKPSQNRSLFILTFLVALFVGGLSAFHLYEGDRRITIALALASAVSTAVYLMGARRIWFTEHWPKSLMMVSASAILVTGMAPSLKFFLEAGALGKMEIYIDSSPVITLALVSMCISFGVIQYFRERRCK